MARPSQEVLSPRPATCARPLALGTPHGTDPRSGLGGFTRNRALRAGWGRGGKPGSGSLQTQRLCKPAGLVCPWPVSSPHTQAFHIGRFQARPGLGGPVRGRTACRAGAPTGHPHGDQARPERITPGTGPSPSPRGGRACRCPQTAHCPPALHSLPAVRGKGSQGRN